MKIVSIYPNFANRGGAQDVVIQLAKALNNENELPIVMTSTPKEQISPLYSDGIKFISFSLKNILVLKRQNVIFISHHRKSTSFLVLLGRIVPGIKIVHIAHNTFNNLKYFTFFPKNIIAVSQGVKSNLIEYFKIPEENITVIYNGIKDIKWNGVSKPTVTNYVNNDQTKILMAGRICPVKQQVFIVQKTRTLLHNNICLYFVGVGEDEEKLRAEIGNSQQYVYLGYKNVRDIIDDFDYICLFSKNEGLGLTLIEGCMFGKPLITNDIAPVLEINEDGNTGFVYHDINDLIEGLNNLPVRNSSQYKTLSENARKRYEELFTEEKMIQNYKAYLFRFE